MVWFLYACLAIAPNCTGYSGGEPYPVNFGNRFDTKAECLARASEALNIRPNYQFTCIGGPAKQPSFEDLITGKAEEPETVRVSVGPRTLSY